MTSNRTYSAQYAGAVLDASGGVSVLMSNIEASVPVNTRVTALRTYTFRGGWSYPKAYCARLGGSALRGGAPAAAAAVHAGRIALAGPASAAPSASATMPMTGRPAPSAGPRARSPSAA